MKTKRTVNFEAKLKGMSVLESQTGETIGHISDLIIDPNEGTFLGIALIRSDKEIRSIAAEYIHIGVDAVMTGNEEPAYLDFSGRYSQGVQATDILGSKLVTEDGRLVGKIEGIYIEPEDFRIFYRVTDSKLRQIFGGGFFISAKVPRTYSADARRFIVPADIEDHHAKKKLTDFTESSKE